MATYRAICAVWAPFVNKSIRNTCQSSSKTQISGTFPQANWQAPIENNQCYTTVLLKKIKHVLRACLHSLVKAEANEEEFESKLVKTRDAVEGCHFLKNSHKLCRDFTNLWRHGKYVYFFYKIILFFSNLTKRRTIYEARI